MPMNPHLSNGAAGKVIDAPFKDYVPSTTYRRTTAGKVIKVQSETIHEQAPAQKKKRSFTAAKRRKWIEKEIPVFGKR